MVTFVDGKPLQSGFSPQNSRHGNLVRENPTPIRLRPLTPGREWTKFGEPVKSA
jgi:hypothetical protein